MDKEEIRQRRASIRAKSDELWADINSHRAEEKRLRMLDLYR